MRFAALAIIVLVGVTACSGQGKSGRHVVYVVDASGSVTADARATAITSVEQGLKWLERSDRVAVAPITGDIHAETLGRVLRFELATRREPYDADRRRLAREVREQLSAFMASATATASAQTDLLGTFSLAAEELNSAPVRVLVCLTDFIQDDSQFNFNTDRRLASERSAKLFARELADGFAERFAGVYVYLGSVQSVDLVRLSKSRRSAIQAFWTSFFEAQGANVRWATDGPGHLPDFLKSIPTE